MEKLQEVWFWVKRVGGVFCAVNFCLYVIRCVMTGGLLSLTQYETFFNKLAHDIFA